VNKPEAVYRHSAVTRLTHWLFFIAFLALISSGLQIFNAAPYLDASDKSSPSHRVLSIASPQDGTGAVWLFGRVLSTTGWLGWADDGAGGKTARAFPGWITIPAYQDLAAGRRWHFFFAWIMIACGLVYVVWGTAGRSLRELILRPADVPKIWRMQLYYLRLRKDPPPHGAYNPLQKLAYTLVIFIFTPLIVLTGFALSPGVDAWAPWLPAIFGGRQVARLWHFAFMLALIGFFLIHITLVALTGVFNNLRSMITGRYRLGAHDGTGI